MTAQYQEHTKHYVRFTVKKVKYLLEFWDAYWEAPLNDEKSITKAIATIFPMCFKGKVEVVKQINTTVYSSDNDLMGSDCKVNFEIVGKFNIEIKKLIGKNQGTLDYFKNEALFDPLPAIYKKLGIN